MSRPAALLDAQAADAAAPDARAALAAHHVAAWAWALALCRGDRHAAHDVLHDAYLKALTGRARYEGRSSYKTWLFGVIRMTAMATRRRRALSDFLFQPIGSEAENRPGPEPLAPATARLMGAIAGLSARQRALINLVFAHDLTIEEAAGVMGISLGAARRHHARAKDKLRAVLTGDP